MKKIILKRMVSCIMAIAMFAMLTACGKKEEPSVKTDATEVSKPAEDKQDKTPEPTKEPVSEPTEAPDPTDEPEPTEEPTEEPTPEPDDDNPYGVDALGNESWVMDVDKSQMRAKIIGYTEFIGDNLLVTVDFYNQYQIAYDAIDGKKVGDTFEINGKTLVIKAFYTMDEYYKYNVPNDSYVDGCRVVVVPENPEEFYTPAELDAKGYYSDPGNANFGLVPDETGENLYGYDDWAWDECYVPEEYVEINSVKLVVTPDTVVWPAYKISENAPDTLSGTEYLLLRDDEDAQNAKGIRVYNDVEVYITEVLSDSGRSTGEIGVISEIYMP